MEQGLFLEKLCELLDTKSFIFHNKELDVYFGKYRNHNIAVTVAPFSPHIAIKIEEVSRNTVLPKILRLGTCGGLQQNQKIGDVIICTDAIRGDGCSKLYVSESFPATADYNLTNELIANFKKEDIPYTIGTLWSNDARYVEKDEDVIKFSNLNVLGVEMDTSCLFVVSRSRKVKSSSISIVSDLPINELGSDVKGDRENCTFENLVMPSVEKSLKVILDTIIE